MAYTLDTNIGEILKDKKAMEVLERYVPGLSTNPMLAMAEGMTLRSLLELPQAKQFGITEKMIIDIVGEVNALK